MLQGIQGRAHMSKVGGAIGGEGEIAARKQFEPEVVFQLPQPVADRAHRDTQRFTRLADAAQPGHGFKRHQALDGGDVGVHRENKPRPLWEDVRAMTSLLFFVDGGLCSKKQRALKRRLAKLTHHPQPV